MAILIKPSGEKVQVSPAAGGVFSLKELQGLVGGYIEAMPEPPPGKVVYMNEDGRRLGLLPNVTATMELAPLAWTLVGNVLVCDLKEGGANEEDE